ncbi:MAG: pilus assembly protein PilP [Thermodesulfobacteriota bacterium]|nr:pilus assembly protein PilP [Thermodesulfobacteriota bacterium]
MHKHFIIICNIACFICCIFLTTGCDNQDESPQKAVVVSKKIVVSKSSAQKPGDQKKTAIAKPVAKKRVSKPESKVTETKVEKTVQKPVISKAREPGKADEPISKQPEKITPLKPESKKETVTDDTDRKPVTLASLKMKFPVTTVLYNPEGKIDPFAPLFREEKPASAKTVKKGKGKICIPLTPLQKIDLSQLRLVGIIRSASGNKAMVEEASGKGYVIKKGTYIGINCGTVGEILKDRVIVDEPLLPVSEVDKDSIYDVEGKNFFISEFDGKNYINLDGKKFEAKILNIDGKSYYVNPQEMKLQKPPGEY